MVLVPSGFCPLPPLSAAGNKNLKLTLAQGCDRHRLCGEIECSVLCQFQGIAAVNIICRSSGGLVGGGILELGGAAMADLAAEGIAGGWGRGWLGRGWGCKGQDGVDSFASGCV